MTRRNLVRRGSPPSSYSIQALIEGEEGAMGRVLEATLLRTAFVLPGLYMTTPYRGAHLLRVSLAASASITLALIGFYTLKANGVVESAP